MVRVRVRVSSEEPGVVNGWDRLAAYSRGGQATVRVEYFVVNSTAVADPAALGYHLVGDVGQREATDSIVATAVNGNELSGGAPTGTTSYIGVQEFIVDCATFCAPGKRLSLHTIDSLVAVPDGANYYWVLGLVVNFPDL